jgi:hypothetical protein
LIQLALQESAHRAKQTNESEGANPAEQQFRIAFSLALQTEKQAEAEGGAKLEGEIEIKHLVIA